MRRILLFVPLAFVLAADRPVDEFRPVPGSGSDMTATPIALDASDPARRRVGRLIYRGGWELTSADPAFGSFSAMYGEAGGLVLLSDAGGVFRFTLDARGRPARARFEDLPTGPGTGRLKQHRDSEAAAQDPAGRHVWVGFESENAIWRYAGDLSRAEAHARPDTMRNWPINGGAEAMARLGDGRFLVFAERGEGPPGAYPAVLFDRDPTDPKVRATQFFLRPPDDYHLTDAAQLPDGRLILLHRRIGIRPYLSAKLTLLDPRAIRRDEIAVGEEIAHLAPPLAVDNMEALAVTREKGSTIVWIASDDNFGGALQRSLLLKFSLLDD